MNLFFFNYDEKICFYVKKTIFFSFLLNFSKITEDETWKCTQKKVWNFQQTVFLTTLKLTYLGFAFQNTVKLLVIAHQRVKHFFVEKCCFWVIFKGSHLSKKKQKKGAYAILFSLSWQVKTNSWRKQTNVKTHNCGIFIFFCFSFFYTLQIKS